MSKGTSLAVKRAPRTDEQGKHTLSFVGIAPIDSPQIVALIVLDKPADDKLSSNVAAKALGEIVSQTLEYLGEARNYSEQDVSRLTKLCDVPDLTGMTLAQARKELSTVGLNLEAADSGMGEQTLIRSQSPAPNSQLHSRGLVVVYPDSGPHEDWVVVPDFSKKTVSEAISAAADNGLNIRIEGDGLGLAVRQDPAPTHGGKSDATSTTPDPAVPETDGGETASEAEPETGTGPEETVLTQEAGQLLRGSVVRIWFEAAEEIAVDPSATVETAATNP